VILFRVDRAVDHDIITQNEETVSERSLLLMCHNIFFVTRYIGGNAGVSHATANRLAALVRYETYYFQNNFFLQ
jgi:hypothetical protein